MEDGSPDDWLPEGWRVQVHVRKSGKKDKWYFPPTGGAKFYSKLEVTRYLIDNGNGINNGDDESVSNTRSSNNVNTIDSTSNLNTTGNITTPTSTVKHSNNFNSANITSTNITSTPATGKNINNIMDSGNHFGNSTPESEENEENGTHKRSSKQVAFEKATAEGLPPGWTKEVKVTKKGSKIRRDPVLRLPLLSWHLISLVFTFSTSYVVPLIECAGCCYLSYLNCNMPWELSYMHDSELIFMDSLTKPCRLQYYTDPEYTYTFRSMKDALRYIQTGEVGRLAIKRKGARHGEDAEDDETPSSTPAKIQKLGTDTTMNGTHQNLKVSEVEPVGNNQAFKVAPPAPETLSDIQAMQREEMDQTLKATELATTVVSEMVPENHTVQQKEKEIEATPLEAKGVSDMQPVQQQKVENHETKKLITTGKSKKKEDVVQLPRRASKRLAALPLQPTTSELEASPSSHQAAAATVSLYSATAIKTPSQQQLHQATLVKPTSEPTDPKLEINYLYHDTSEARKACPQLSDSKLSETGKKAKEAEAGNATLDAHLGELWEDPCIAFAIKTLTGSLDDMPLGSTNNGLGDSATSKEQVDSPEVGTPKTQPFTNSQNPDSPLNLSAAYTWATDPCIEFAIKTLTGAIPLESDIFTKQEQATSSQPTPGHAFLQSTTILPTEAARVEPLSLPQTKNAKYTGGSSSSAGMERRVTRSQRNAM